MSRRLTIPETAENFSFSGKLAEYVPYGSGHINETWRLTFDTENGRKQVILQKMNKEVFKNPEELMENVCGVTAWLRRKIEEAGGDPMRETLNLVPAAGGGSCYMDPDGEYWRMFHFIDGATSFDQVQSDEDFYQSAVAFGRFQRLLSDYPADTLHETIPEFHNTVDRYKKFCAALNADVCGRAAGVQEEIRFVREREPLCHVLCDLLASGVLPLRVTHNDTKLNNIMIDDVTHQAICVIDLDTVMPGLSLYDFGDSIRFGASTAAEDERDLSLVSCDLHLFEVYAKGYIEGCAGALTKEELALLPMGALMMTFECGMRFLTDYLEGDHYFRIHREGHNLDRARTQFRLVEDMEAKMNAMKEIVNRYRQRI